jgi:hypothetical protein
MKRMFIFMLTVVSVIVVIFGVSAAVQAQKTEVCQPVITVDASVSNLLLTANALGQRLERWQVSTCADQDVKITNHIQVPVRAAGFVNISNPRLFVNGVSFGTIGSIETVNHNFFVVKFDLPSPIFLLRGQTISLDVSYDTGDLAGNALIYPSFDSPNDIPMEDLSGQRLIPQNPFPLYGRPKSTLGGPLVYVVGGGGTSLRDVVNETWPQAVHNWVILRVQPGQYTATMEFPGTTKFMIMADQPGSVVNIVGENGRVVNRRANSQLVLRDMSFVGSPVPDFYRDSTIFAEFGGSMEIVNCYFLVSGQAVSTNYSLFTTVADCRFEGAQLSGSAATALLFTYEDNPRFGYGARVFNNSFKRLGKATVQSSRLAG